MSSHLRRPSRHSVRRIAVYILIGPLFSVIAFDFTNSFARYSEVGDVTVLLLTMLFAAWAWWYDVRRDRRRERTESPADRDSGRGSARSGGDQPRTS